ncbi:MAG TPA: GldG family protein [Bryobacteraceae bacterium]|nr:GldG family protein [Bryobacteraceae bacterium]
MKTEWLKTRQTKYTAYVTLYIVIILAVLVAANFLANRYDKSYDSTSNKQFSLSDQTKKIVKNLKQDVTITDYDKTSNFTSAKDLLDRYSVLSPKMHIDYIDPDKKPALARAAGVRTYGTIVVATANRKQDAKSLTEEDVTGALVRALKGNERTVCFVSGSGEHSLDETGASGYSSAKDLLEKNNYKTRVIRLIGGGAAAPPAGKIAIGEQTSATTGVQPEVPKDCTVLVVAGPRFDYVQPEVNAIKTYVEGGGRALFLLDPPLKLGKQDTDISDNAALDKMLADWGVTVNNNLVVDTSGVGQLFGLSEVVPLVTSYESHPIVRDMKEVATAFPLTRSLDVKSGNKTTVEKLFSTSDNSLATNNLSSAQISVSNKNAKGPFTLAAAGTYNTGQPNNEGRFVVTGSSSWIANNILRFNGNRDLFLNMMNWLSSDEDLISIRPKEPADRRLTLTRRQMAMVFYSSIVFIPLIILACGLSVWWKRR